MHYVKRLSGDKLFNARDLGGYAVDGGMTKYGVFLRSELPMFWTEKDVRTIRDYGVALSLDFRSETETVSKPSLLKGLDWVEYKALPAFTVGNSNKDAMVFYTTENIDESFRWSKAYIGLVENCKAWMKNALEIAADCGGVCHFHCHTGKDRTGIFSAVLLSIAGVSAEEIAADYCVSQSLLDRFYELCEFKDFSRKDRSSNTNNPLLLTSPDNMFELLDYFNETYGGVMGYLKQCGVSNETIEKIRNKFVEKF